MAVFRSVLCLLDKYATYRICTTKHPSNRFSALHSPILDVVIQYIFVVKCEQIASGPGWDLELLGFGGAGPER